MTVPPPVLILLDFSALTGKTSREWQEYSHIGACYVPQIMYDEIEFLTGRATEPELEKTAREFVRFFPSSNWQLTNSHATHPAITPPDSSALSKQARLVVAIAQCAYGFAQENSDNLVVFVSNTQAILQRIPSLGVPNLCGVTAAALLQWVRTGQQPPAVVRQLEVLDRAAGVQENGKGQPGRQRQTSIPASPLPAISGPASADRPTSSNCGKSSTGASLLPRLIAGAVTLIAIALIGSIGWRLVQPASFDRFWKQMGLPALPGQK